MQTKTYEVYKWNELPEESKEKALKRYRFFDVEDSYWHDYDGKTGFSSAEIKKYRLDVKHAGDLLKFKDCYFDLDWNYRYIQFTDAEFAHDETARKFLGVPKALWNQVCWSFTNRRYGYRGETATRLEFERDNGEGFTPKQLAILDRAVERFANKMREALRDLQREYDYQVSDEAIIESFEINNYDFTLDGRID